MNTVIVGASSGVGAALARHWATLGQGSLVLASRNQAHLEAVAQDLRTRGSLEGNRVHVVAVDVAAEDFDPRAFLDRCTEKLPANDCLLLPCGAMDEADDGPASPEVTRRLFRVNALGPMELIAEFARRFERQGKGSIVAFSSIATGAPRRRNAAYAAAKSALESYCRSLRHHLSTTPVRVNVVALGYVNTPMTAGKKLMFPVSEPEAVAKYVFRRAGDDFGKAYYPGWWLGIVTVLRSLPWFLYKKLSF